MTHSYKRYFQLLIVAVALLAMAGVAYGQGQDSFSAEISPTNFVPGDHSIDVADDDQISPAVSHANGVTLVGALRRNTKIDNLAGSHMLAATYATGRYTSLDSNDWVILPGGIVSPGSQRGEERGQFW